METGDKRKIIKILSRKGGRRMGGETTSQKKEFLKLDRSGEERKQ